VALRSSGGPLRRLSTVDALAEAIREQILEGALPPRTALRESEISRTFGVSRHTVRTALQALGHEGLVHHAPSRSAWVRELTAEDVADVYRLRILLEVEAARTVAGRSDALGPAREALDALRATTAPWGSVRDADLTFHQAIVDAVGSPRITRTFASLMTELRLAFRQLRPELEDHDLIVRQHADILDALERGGARGAESAVRAHLAEARDRVRSDAALARAADTGA